jgi:CheY-like chemotaxis protein
VASDQTWGWSVSNENTRADVALTIRRQDVPPPSIGSQNRWCAQKAHSIIARSRIPLGRPCFVRDRLICNPLKADASPTVLAVDDDPDLRHSVGRLLQSLGMDVQLFASIRDFLKSDPPDGPNCLVLDVRLPGQSGLDLQGELAGSKRELPILHHRARRYPDDGASDEGRRHRVPDEASPRSGPLRRHSARHLPRSLPAREREHFG